MTITHPLIGPLALGFAIASAHAQEQSLAEASKQAAEARAAKKAEDAKNGVKVAEAPAPKPKTSYTDKDLKAVPAGATTKAARSSIALPACHNAWCSGVSARARERGVRMCCLGGCDRNRTAIDRFCYHTFVHQITHHPITS